ncbi:SDR family NAD(P)-dependent oxidoreductase, partial [Mycobacteroides abscessus]
SVSKAGVKMLTECLRLELGPKGVGVSAICPGFINTNIGVHGTMVGVDPEIADASQRRIQRIREFTEKLPWTPMSPELVARAVTRAIRLDLVVVPVKLESWFGYFVSRALPAVNRRLMAPFGVDRFERRGARALAKQQEHHVPALVESVG